MPSVRLLLCALLVVLFHAGFAWLSNQSQDAGIDVPSGKLKSLSFAPFREGYSPLEEVFPTEQQVDEDLRLLADKTHSIRTYSSLGGGLEKTAELARKYGLNVTQGCWLGYGYADNKKEVNALIAAANANPDVIKRVIVGNEVLLRGDMDVDRLIGYIREVKRAVRQPVSYADVWSMYMKHPRLIKEVDFITIHILPYWEDEPVAVEHASEHLEKIVRQVEDEARGIAPGKPILIGESGWPSTGRQRGLAVPGVVNEAKFIRGMIQVATRHGFDYNIVEAFDQPWKSKLEGVVGANWGLFSADRQPVFPLAGSVYENPSWLFEFAASVLLWLVAVVFYVKAVRFDTWMKDIAFLALAQVFSVGLVNLASFLWYTSYSGMERAYAVVMVIANGVIAILLLQRCLDMLNQKLGDQKLANRLRNGYLFFIVLALYKTYGLAVAGRYLSFPVEQFAIPVFGVFGLMLCYALSNKAVGRSMFAFDQLSGWVLHARRERLIAYALAFAAAAMVLGEVEAFMEGRDFVQAHPGFAAGFPVALEYALGNRQLLLWLGCLLSLSLPFWRNYERKREKG
jgi:exo-beta-1,3-glucanase (GH17 family)/zinc transporter ZupT